MIVRTYKASSQAKAAEKMRVDGTPPGHVMGGQTWAEGGRGCAASGFILLGILALLVGLLFWPIWVVAVICLIIGLASGRKGGELTVTWVPAPDVPKPAPVSAAARPADDVTVQLASLKDMHERGLVTQEEYDAKKADLLSRM